jgi:hypothetical protein
MSNSPIVGWYFQSLWATNEDSGAMQSWIHQSGKYVQKKLLRHWLDSKYEIKYWRMHHGIERGDDKWWWQMWFEGLSAAILIISVHYTVN